MNDKTLINYHNLEAGNFRKDPYPHFIATNIISQESKTNLINDYPEISKSGFFPLSLLEQKGAFKNLIEEMQSEKFAETLTNILGIELRDKPHMITIRKWSAIKDGRIHNDGEAKIVTALLYLNDHWNEKNSSGNFRILRNDNSFDDYESEVSADFGSFVAFVRTDNSWHGHKPFAGERRVVQITWLKSHADLQRKHDRGKLSFFLKRFIPKLF